MLFSLGADSVVVGESETDAVMDTAPPVEVPELAPLCAVTDWTLVGSITVAVLGMAVLSVHV